MCIVGLPWSIQQAISAEILFSPFVSSIYLAIAVALVQLSVIADLENSGWTGHKAKYFQSTIGCNLDSIFSKSVVGIDSSHFQDAIGASPQPGRGLWRRLRVRLRLRLRYDPDNLCTEEISK